MSGQKDLVVRFLVDVASERERWTSYVRRHMPTSLLRILEPEDVISEAVFRALARGDTFAGDDTSQLAAWFRAIVQNTIRKLLRDQLRRAPHFLDDGSVPQPEDESPGPGTRTQVRETVTLLSKALRRLPPRQTILFVEVHLQGVRLAESARKLALTPASASSTLYRAREKLRAMLSTLATP